MRFSPLPIVRGHFKALRNVNTGSRDWVALGILAVPLAVAAVSAWRGLTIMQPAGLIAGVAILGGMLVSAFAQMTTLRLRLEDRAESHHVDPFHRQRDAFDETIAHLLMAVLLCAVDAVVLVLALNADPTSTRFSVYSCIAVWASSYVVLMIFLVLPRMYYAYTQAANVGQHLSGFHTGSTAVAESRPPDGKSRTSV